LLKKEKKWYSESILIHNLNSMAEEPAQEIPKGKEVGKIVHYYGNIGVGIIELKSALKVGDEVVIAGQGKEFEQTVDSLQIEHDQVQKAKKGDSVGIKMNEPVKEGGVVYLKG